MKWALKLQLNRPRSRQGEKHIGYAGPRAVLLMLAWHYNDTERKAFPKVETLAEECWLSKRQVFRHLETLKQWNLVVVEAERRYGRQAANSYRLPEVEGILDDKYGLVPDDNEPQSSETPVQAAVQWTSNGHAQSDVDVIQQSDVDVILNEFQSDVDVIDRVTSTSHQERKKKNKNPPPERTEGERARAGVPSLAEEKASSSLFDDLTMAGEPSSTAAASFSSSLQSAAPLDSASQSATHSPNRGVWRPSATPADYVTGPHQRVERLALTDGVLPQHCPHCGLPKRWGRDPGGMLTCGLCLTGFTLNTIGRADGREGHTANTDRDQWKRQQEEKARAYAAAYEQRRNGQVSHA